MEGVRQRKEKEMKNPFKKNKEKTELEKQIDQRIDNLWNTADDADKDEKAVENLKKLIDARSEYMGTKINPNTIISAVASIGGIVLVLKHEKFEVITSKAWTLIQKVWK